MRETDVSLLSTHSPSPLPFAYISLENIQTGREAKVLSLDLGTLNIRPVDPTHRKGLLTRTNRESQTVKTDFPSSLKSQAACPCRGRDYQPFRQESHSERPSPQETLLQQPFLVEKKGEGQRSVINLSSLNSFVHHHHFKMEDLKVIADILRSQDFMCKIDLKDAYFAVPIHPEHQKLLCFQFQNVTYRFKCLPFGLTSAPRVFTKVLKPLVAFVRRLGLRI